MIGYDYKKEIVKELVGVKIYNPTTVFDDALTVMATTLRNSIDDNGRDDREKAYREIMRRYESCPDGIFVKIFGCLTLAFEQCGRGKYSDILGEVFHEINANNKHTGQFFTPQHLSDLMGSISINKKDLDAYNYITVNEPTCGSGSTLIGAINKALKLGYNPQMTMLIECGDLDLRAVKMCYIQLSILGMSAIVRHMDTLKMEVYDTWVTPSYVINGYRWRGQVRQVSE